MINWIKRDMVNIYIITLDGPEWSSIIEAHDDEMAANTRCAELNDQLRQKENKDVFESLSTYYVKETTFFSKREEM